MVKIFAGKDIGAELHETAKQNWLAVVFLNESGQLSGMLLDVQKADGESVPLRSNQITSVVKVLQVSLFKLESKKNSLL